MKHKTTLFIILLLFIATYQIVAQKNIAPAHTQRLPDRYFDLLEAGLERIQAKLNADPNPTLRSLEKGSSIGHFPHAILVPAVLYTKKTSRQQTFG